MSNKVKITYNATTKGGKFKVRSRNNFLKDILQAFPNDELIITVEKRRKKRSNQQNRYYWSCVIPAIRSGLTDCGNLGVTNEDAHELLKHKFNPKMIIDKNGEITEIPGSTTKLTTSEFADFIAQVQVWASEFLGVIIPDPNEQSILPL